jgi:hypothetical protein
MTDDAETQKDYTKNKLIKRKYIVRVQLDTLREESRLKLTTNFNYGQTFLTF